MTSQSAYLYFYSLSEDSSPILDLAIACASKSFKRLYLALSDRQYRHYKSMNMPSNVHIDIISNDDVYNPLINLLCSHYNNNILQSNCPPVEIHCVNRWIYLQKRNYYGEKSLYCIDWDTLVFSGISEYDSYIDSVDIAATNLMTLGWNETTKEPIWSLCPNMLYVSTKALDIYIEYLEKYLVNSGKFGSIVSGFFCDMQPWSSVISSALIGKYKLKMLDLNSINSELPLIDHNFRAIHDCGVDFMSTRYFFAEGTKTYLDEPYLLAKTLLFTSNGEPFFSVRKHQDISSAPANVSIAPSLRKAAAIHFSGVEGKQVLLQTFLPNIHKFLERDCI